jgi:DNA-directed RNA polymerase specialized sigma24 family protein
MEAGATVRSSIARSKLSMNDSAPFYERVIGPIEDRMIRSVWRITRTTQDAEDAMQNALMVIWKCRGRIDQHASPQALVLKICIDAACDVARRRARRRRKVEPHDPSDKLVDGAQSPWEELAQKELSLEILTAIDGQESSDHGRGLPHGAS